MVSRQYLGDSQFHIGFWRVARSVLIFLGAPLVAAILTRLIGVRLRTLFLPVRPCNVPMAHTRLQLGGCSESESGRRSSAHRVLEETPPVVIACQPSWVPT